MAVLVKPAGRHGGTLSDAAQDKGNHGVYPIYLNWAGVETVDLVITTLLIVTTSGVNLGESGSS